MMKKTRLIIILLLGMLTSLSHAQTNFFYRAIFDSLKYSFASDVKVVAGKIYQFGIYERQKPTIASMKTFLNTYSLDGGLLYSEKFSALNLSDSISYYTGGSGLYLHNNSKMYTSGTNLYEPYRSAGNVYVFDTSGSYTYITEKQDSDIYFYGATISGSDLYAIGGIADTFLDRSDLYLVKYDTALNKIWERKWDWGEADYTRSIFPTKDSGVVFAVSSGMPYFAWEGHVVKVNKDGDIVFDKYNPSVLGRGSLRLYDYDEHNNRLLFARGYYVDPMYYMFKIELIMTDTALNLEWKKSWTVDSFSVFQSAYDFWNAIRVNDGYVICGNKDFAIESWVFKVDFKGNMIWEATYKDLPNISYGFYRLFYTTGIDTLPEDRGYVLSGSTYDSLSRQVAFIMSIDKDGCFSDDTCEAKQYVSITYFDAAIKVQVFPNPIQDYVSIKVTNAQLNGAELMITDLLGRTVAKQTLLQELTTFSTQDWAKGMYVWSLVEDGRLVRSGKLVKE